MTHVQAGKNGFLCVYIVQGNFDGFVLSLSNQMYARETS